MPRKKKTETEDERVHGHCADVLMNDFGIPKEMRAEVSTEVAKVWKQNTMIHCLIISSIRGFQPHGATRGLETFLRRHARHEPKHQKPTTGRRPSGSFDSRGYYHPPEESYDDF